MRWSFRWGGAAAILPQERRRGELQAEDPRTCPARTCSTGSDGLDVDLPGGQRHRARRPGSCPACPTRRRLSARPCASPIGGAAAARARDAPSDRVAVVIPDITRPLPTDRLLPWLFAELAHVPAEHFTIVNGTGSHRANTPDELRAMVGAGRARALPGREPRRARPGDAAPWRARRRTAQPVLHEPRLRGGRPAHRARASSSRTSWPASRAATRASSRPWPTSTSIMRYHGAADDRPPAEHLGRAGGQPDPGASSARNGALLPLDFCINVTLNRDRADHPLLLRRGAARPTRGLRLRARRRRWSPASAVPDRGHDQQRLPAGPEPLPGGEGHVGGRADRRARAASSPPPRAATTASPPTATSRSCSSTTPRRARCSTPSRRRASRCTTSGRPSSWPSSG